jgi:hypothetical protein
MHSCVHTCICIHAYIHAYIFMRTYMAYSITKRANMSANIISTQCFTYVFMHTYMSYQHTKTCQHVCEYNLYSMLHEARTGNVYRLDPNLDDDFGRSFFGGLAASSKGANLEVWTCMCVRTYVHVWWYCIFLRAAGN